MRYGSAALVLLVAVALLLAPAALAQTPPPGAIFDLSATPQFPAGGVLSGYQLFSASFVADNPTEFVSFAFREVPAFFAFDNASVIQSGSSTNLLSDPGFETATDGQNCNHNNSLGCPPGWNAWIQPVDVSAIGQVASNTNPYGCPPNGAFAGNEFWCDGSVQGYDAVYQQLSGLSVGSTYNIGWELGDNSGSPINNPNIDMLVYAGDNIPVGTVPIGPTPEPSSILLLASVLPGLAGFGALRRRRGRK